MTYDAKRWTPSDELLDRFLAEQIAPDERAAVEAWLTGTLGGKRSFDALRQLRFGAVGDSSERERLWQRIEQRCEGYVESSGIGGGRREDVVRKGVKGRTPGWSVFKTQPLPEGIRGIGVKRRSAPHVSAQWIRYTIAGVIVGVLGVFLGWNGRAHHAGHFAARTAFSYATTNGERANITLPDGNQVTLNVGSRLDVPADYATGDHQVRLHGEALFTVTHHSESPFAVLVGTTTTRVLGTKFLVRQYATDTAVRVAVQEGRVAVGATVVSASQVAEIGPAGKAHVGAADASLFSFPTGVLALNGMPLSAAIPELNRWYNADLRLGDTTLATLPIHGEFTAGAISELANDLTEAFGIRVVRMGRVLTLYSGTR